VSGKSDDSILGMSIEDLLALPDYPRGFLAGIPALRG
jgi:hypothetical protein